MRKTGNVMGRRFDVKDPAGVFLDNVPFDGLVGITKKVDRGVEPQDGAEFG